ncbi:unnamed protein product, partial [Urochloa humidicola]
DLSQNLFAGNVPSSFSNLQSLSYINLAYNSLSGDVPEHLLQVAQYNYTGNHLNCGKHLISCEKGSTRTGRQKSSTLKVVLGIFSGSVTLLVIGVLFLLWRQRMSYQPEIYTDIYGKNDHGLDFRQKKRFSWRQLLQAKVNSFGEHNVIGKDGVGKRDVEATVTRRE